MVGMLMFLADETPIGGVGSFIAGLIALGIIMLALCWIVFPFIVIGKFNALIGEVRNLRTELKMRRDEDKGKKDDGHRPPLQPEKKSAGDTPAAAATVYKI